jgi:peptidyl-prolyl cis-trans isomerase B (cyclophilin B)
MKECPFCGVEVNKAKLEKHFLKAHGDLSKKKYTKAGYEKPKKEADFQDQTEQKRVARKRTPKKKDTVGIIVMVISMVVIFSLVGYGVYLFLDQGGPDEEGEKATAVMSTTLGVITIELDMDRAPATSGNFINLARNGFYNGVIFHRVMANFMVQGGGFEPDGNQKTAPQIPWESTGLKNLRYTISMARSGDANKQSDSGTGSSQFFINTVNNPSLDDVGYPYVVFGKVTGGFSVVDAIEALPTGSYNGHENWPNEPPVINGIVIEE